MAQGENAEKNGRHREYWSRRYRGCLSWGRAAKKLTHRKERAASRRAERKLLLEEQQQIFY